MDGPALPRSIRWRLQIGVWSLPEDMDAPDSGGARGTYENGSGSGSGSGCDRTWTLEEIWERNHDQIEIQRGNYNLLVEMLQEIMEQDDQPYKGMEHGDVTAAAAAPVPSAPVQTPVPTAVEDVDIDPLTALVKERDAQEQHLHELDLKYRKRRARRKRGVVDGESDRGDTYSSSLTLNVIEKDLVRLPQEHHTYHHSRKNFDRQGEDVSFEVSAMERSTRLTEMLQIYAHQNPHIGYRQGMHEISSYLLLVIEMDLFDQESQQREVTSLLDPNYIAHDAYYMLLAIMNQLGPAYDVKINTGAESPMEQMAQSILAKIRDIANDKSLHQHLLSLNCPPELYCTRWVRLMFSREVAGWKNVLLLWDIFLDLTSKSPLTSMSRSRYTRPGVTPALELGNFPLMMVLEATSASMILLQRNALLSIHDGTDADSIHRLMNIPPLKNILPLTATLLSMMRRIQLQLQNVKQPQAKRRSFTLSEIAQNAFSTGGQSILNILQGGNGQVCSEDEAPRLTAVTSVEKVQDMNLREASSTSAVTSLEPLTADMARRLKTSVFTVKTYLQALEQGSAANLGSSIPQSVWDALNEIDGVQTQLTS